MAETLLAIVLIISSARGSNLVCRWPPAPQPSPRLSRPRPNYITHAGRFDNPWRAANIPDGPLPDHPIKSPEPRDEWDYIWQRPYESRDRSVSFSHQSSSHHAPSGRTSPVKDGGGFGGGMDDGAEDPPLKDNYDDFLGYDSALLANMLSPQRPLCHQKFELVVDDLCFIGHPVCAELDGVWRFKPEKRDLSRGRGSRKRTTSVEDLARSIELDKNASSSMSIPPAPINAKPAWLHSFHLVFVHDLPDPSSSASGNISKYFDVIYEQIAFTVTAVLFQEQVMHNFVEAECELLGKLKDDYVKRGEPFGQFMTEAIHSCSIAPAMKILYESIKSRSLAPITIHNLTLELQLPPYLDSLLHSADETDADLNYQGPDLSSSTSHGLAGAGGSRGGWGKELSFAWRLPSLDPWKSLLLLDGPEGKDWADVYASLRGAAVREENRVLGEQLVRFLEMADVTLSFVDMASLLDWDLESQVFSIVRWLVHHRRAKVVDIVHRGLKTVFTVPLKIEAPVAQLSVEFRAAFPDPTIPSLPSLLSTISSSQSKHFYATIVPSKDRIPAYLSVVQWMLKKDLLVTLHLRIRVFVPKELKSKVRGEWRRRRAEAKRRKEEKRRLAVLRGEGEESVSRTKRQKREREALLGRGRKRTPINVDDKEDRDESGTGKELADALLEESQSPPWLSLSPKSIRQSTHRALVGLDPKTALADLSGMPIAEETGDLDLDGENATDDIDEGNEEAEAEEDLEIGELEFESKEGEREDRTSSIVIDPGRATYKERQWLEAMSDGKDPVVAKRFQQINRYFDGKCTDDEILFRAEITRKQLREILHHFEEYGDLANVRKQRRGRDISTPFGVFDSMLVDCNVSLCASGLTILVKRTHIDDSTSSIMVTCANYYILNPCADGIVSSGWLIYDKNSTPDARISDCHRQPIA